jgi:hypothetical protein
MASLGPHFGVPSSKWSQSSCSALLARCLRPRLGSTLPLWDTLILPHCARITSCPVRYLGPCLSPVPGYGCHISYVGHDTGLPGWCWYTEWLKFFIYMDPQNILPEAPHVLGAALPRGYPLCPPVLLSSSGPGPEKRIRAYCLSLRPEWHFVFCLCSRGQVALLWLWL